jgi:hypothetical protein
MMRGSHFVNPLRVSMPPVALLPEKYRDAFGAEKRRLDRLLGIAGTEQLYASHP